MQGGGIIIFIRHCFSKLINIDSCLQDSIIWLSIDKNIVTTESRVYIACVYIPPVKSVYYKRYDCDLFTELEHSIELYSALGQVILIGDTNSRTATLDDYVRNDRIHDTLRHRLDDLFNYDIDIDLPKRINPDDNTNCFGPKLLNLCKASGLRIVNGRHKNGFSNGFTFYGANGMSVIDYLLMPSVLFGTVTQFIISNLTSFSDHSFLHIELKLLSSIRINSEKQAPETGIRQAKYKWNSEFKDQCGECLRVNMDRINYLTNCINFENQGSLDSSLSDFTVMLEDIMSPFFKKTPKTTKRAFIESQADKPWFNARCKELYRKYIDSLNTFNKAKTSTNHTFLLQAKKEYKVLERRLKRNYMRAEGNMMDFLRTSNPKLFYSKFRNKRFRHNSVTLEPFFEHFKNFSSSSNNVADDSDFLYDTDGDCVFEELDKEITETEILKAISNLKRDKSHGIDGILNEYFIEYKTVFIPVLLKVFNGILQTGFFPTAWSTAVLVPIFKRGNVKDPNNYRGISLVSNFGKLFTSVLNQRLLDWSENFDILSDAQFGFRPGFGTADAIFALVTVIFKSLSAKNRLYCCFVDYTKAFDTIERLMLWYKIAKVWYKR